MAHDVRPKSLVLICALAQIMPLAALAQSTSTTTGTASTGTAFTSTTNVTTETTTPSANTAAIKPPASDAREVEQPQAPITTTKWKPGEELSITTNTEDLIPTDDIVLAQKQVQAYPDSPEASFILAVALTRTSRVEEALKEVRRARKLAETKGGTAYFDKMIESYEDMLKNYPKDIHVRYGLAWAYYMKAYLLANYSRKVAAWKAVNGDPAHPNAKPAAVPAAAAAPKLDLNNLAGSLGSLVQGGGTQALKIPSVMDKVDPADVPQIKKFYEMALQKLDDLIAQKPDDIWAVVYRAHLRAEYNGNLDDAMKVWTMCRDKYPNNPAAYFFLGEGYLKQGNLKESINNVSRAVALRAMGY